MLFLQKFCLILLCLDNLFLMLVYYGFCFFASLSLSVYYVFSFLFLLWFVCLFVSFLKIEREGIELERNQNKRNCDLNILYGLFFNKNYSCQVGSFAQHVQNTGFHGRYCTSLNLALGKWKEDQKFKLILGYTRSLKSH